MTAQEFSDGFVSGREPLLTVHDHKGNTGFLESKSRLLPDLRQKLTVVIEHQSTGIDDLEFPIAPIAVLIRAIPCHPGFVMNDRLTTAAQTIDQRGLADVGTSDDRNDRTRHRAEFRSINDLTDPRKRKLFEMRPARPKRDG